ncbi:coilin-like isoform X2 [Ipomoea triloba]|uniref:coilin-like isoform X2 n=1 Tax=Ipomoea triloba TaxID=35885 RepID=UPI00125DB1C6|nr:coilin-like isoform X2 [Ipomoea triloba]
MEDEEGLRIKVVFDDGDILSDSQKSQGLQRSWLLLKPTHHRIISQFSSDLFHNFKLHNSCPHGILLSMDGFVLPPFESTCFFKDKDVISVKKKKKKKGGSLVIVGNTPNLVENVQSVEKPSVNTKALLLANEAFNKEHGGYECDKPEEERRDQVDDYNLHKNLLDGVAVSKKRKASEELHSTKKKKQCPQVAEECNIDAQTEPSQPTKKSKRDRTAKISNKKEQQKSESKMDGAEDNNETVEMTKDNHTKPNTKKNDHIQEYGKESVDVTAKPEEIPKQPSRSSRRQYAKRRLIREMAKILKENADSQLKALVCNINSLKGTQSKDGSEEAVRLPKGRKWKKGQARAKREEDISQPKGHKHWKLRQTGDEIKETPGQPKGLLYWKGLLFNDMTKDMDKQERTNSKNLSCSEPDQNSDNEDGVVPIELTPGHIHSEIPGKGEAVQQNQAKAENFRWNGVINKKNGQKLGKEKISFSQRNEINELNKESSEMSSAEKVAHCDGSIDFAKLPSLSNTPKEGDVIAYRLLKLSSNWTAELSPYHVGKVSSFNSESSRASLMPVAGYPFYSKKSGEDECAMQPDSSLYKEDGSLEIDLSSLVDVRVVKATTFNPSKEVSVWTGVGASSNTLTVSSGSSDKQTPTIPENGEVNHEKQMHTCSRENGVNLWDQLSEALSAKKEQLQSSWGKVTPSKISWSYEARGSGHAPRKKGFSRWKNKR